MAGLSCGVLVTDGARLLVGHATRSPRWDIPKGLAEPGEEPGAAAVRELREETGLEVASGMLEGLGVHRYLPGKALALFRWRVAAMPDPGALRCASLVVLADGTSFPEMDRFAVLPWAEALERVGKNMRRVLEGVGPG